MTTKGKGKYNFSKWQVGLPQRNEVPHFEAKTWPVVDEKQVISDLDKYVKALKEMGAEDAQIIPAAQIPLDIRARYVMCQSPRCRWYENNYNCPNNIDISFAEAKQLFSEYKYGLVWKVLPPPEDVLPKRDEDIKKIQRYFPTENLSDDEIWRDVLRLRNLENMGRKLEQIAYYDGYEFSFSVGAGPCLAAHCADVGHCVGLDKGGFCKFVNTKPTGTGCLFIDYHMLGRMHGWGELQPNGNCIFLTDTPKDVEYYNIGLALVW